MDFEQRNKRLRLMIKKVNGQRKKQAKKVDILCNDIIEAQKGFIKKLNTISFAADFYENIVGIPNLNDLLFKAKKVIQDEFEDINITFFLRQQQYCKLHLCEKKNLKKCFTDELVNSICESNKVCTLDDMFEMGFQGNLNKFNEISPVTIPLGQNGLSAGFILIYKSSEKQFSAGEINHICSIVPGLSKAIEACQIKNKTRV